MSDKSHKEAYESSYAKIDTAIGESVMTSASMTENGVVDITGWMLIVAVRCGDGSDGVATMAHKDADPWKRLGWLHDTLTKEQDELKMHGR